jgi:uncharacterized protein (TIGR03435 family)
MHRKPRRSEQLRPTPGDLRSFAALQEQLEAELESQKAPEHVIVIDHMSEPTEN